MRDNLEELLEKAYSNPPEPSMEFREKLLGEMREASRANRGNGKKRWIAAAAGFILLVSLAGGALQKQKATDMGTFAENSVEDGIHHLGATPSPVVDGVVENQSNPARQDDNGTSRAVDIGRQQQASSAKQWEEDGEDTQMSDKESNRKKNSGEPSKKQEDTTVILMENKTPENTLSPSRTAVPEDTDDRTQETNVPSPVESSAQPASVHVSMPTPKPTASPIEDDFDGNMVLLCGVESLYWEQGERMMASDDTNGGLETESLDDMAFLSQQLFTSKDQLETTILQLGKVSSYYENGEWEMMISKLREYDEEYFESYSLCVYTIPGDRTAKITLELVAWENEEHKGILKLYVRLENNPAIQEMKGKEGYRCCFVSLPKSYFQDVTSVNFELVASD